MTITSLMRCTRPFLSVRGHVNIQQRIFCQTEVSQKVNTHQNRISNLKPNSQCKDLVLIRDVKKNDDDSESDLKTLAFITGATVLLAIACVVEESNLYSSNIYGKMSSLKK